MLKAIVKTGFVAGTLDGLAAVFILSKGNFTGVFQYVASGAFGKTAFGGGAVMTAAGVGFHYFNAFAFTLFYFAALPYLSFLRKQVLLSAILYGAFVWCVMNLLVVPLSKITMAPFDLRGASLNMVILVVCIGLPISYFANNFYASKNS